MKAEEWLDQQIDQLAQERRPDRPVDSETAELLAVAIAGKRLGLQAAPSLEGVRRGLQATAPKPARTRSRLTRWAAVAAAAAVLTVGANLLPQYQARQVVYAMEQAVASLTRYHAVIEHKWEKPGEPARTERWTEEFWVDGDRYYWEKHHPTYGTEVVVSDGDREWSVLPDEKRAHHGYPIASDLREWSPASLAKKVIDQPYTVDGEEQVAGRPTVRVKATNAEGYTYTLWIDKATKLPLQYKGDDSDPSLFHYTATYTTFELNPVIDPARFTYQPPEGYAVTEGGTRVETPEAAAQLAGFQPLLPEESPRRIIANKGGITLDFGDAEIDLSQAKPRDNYHPMTVFGWSEHGPVEFHGSGILSWHQDGLRVWVSGDPQGDRVIQLARQLLKDLRLPRYLDTAESFNRQAKEDVWPDMAAALTMERERVKDPTLHTDRTDAQEVALRFLREKGVTVDAASLTEAGNIGVEVLFDVPSGPIQRVYLRQVGRQDGPGLWWVIGYDPR